jgi:hypothetical protein
MASTLWTEYLEKLRVGGKVPRLQKRPKVQKNITENVAAVDLVSSAKKVESAVQNTQGGSMNNYLNTKRNVKDSKLNATKAFGSQFVNKVLKHNVGGNHLEQVDRLGQIADESRLISKSLKFEPGARRMGDRKGASQAVKDTGVRAVDKKVTEKRGTQNVMQNTKMLGNVQTNTKNMDDFVKKRKQQKLTEDVESYKSRKIHEFHVDVEDLMTESTGGFLPWEKRGYFSQFLKVDIFRFSIAKI